MSTAHVFAIQDGANKTPSSPTHVEIATKIKVITQRVLLRRPHKVRELYPKTGLAKWEKQQEEGVRCVARVLTVIQNEWGTKVSPLSSNPGRRRATFALLTYLPLAFSLRPARLFLQRAST